MRTIDARHVQNENIDRIQYLAHLSHKIREVNIGHSFLLISRLLRKNQNLITLILKAMALNLEKIDLLNVLGYLFRFSFIII